MSKEYVRVSEVLEQLNRERAELEKMVAETQVKLVTEYRKAVASLAKELLTLAREDDVPVKSTQDAYGLLLQVEWGEGEVGVLIRLNDPEGAEVPPEVCVSVAAREHESRIVFHGRVPIAQAVWDAATAWG